MNEHSSEELVAVFVAPDEPTASIVVGLLQSEGIDAMLQPKRTAWAGQASLIGAIPSDGVWGDILVFEKDAERSRELIEAYHTEDADEKLTPLERKAAELRGSYSWWFVRSLYMFAGVWAVVGAWAAWAGSDAARLFIYLLAGATLIGGGLAQTNARRLVPEQFARPTRQASVALVVAGVILGVFYAAELMDLGVPRSAELIGSSLVAAGSAYGALKHHPSAAQERESDDE